MFSLVLHTHLPWLAHHGRAGLTAEDRILAPRFARLSRDAGSVASLSRLRSITSKTWRGRWNGQSAPGLFRIRQWNGFWQPKPGHVLQWRLW